MSTRNREFMKSGSFGSIMKESDQAKGVKFPAHGMKHGGELVELPSFEGVVANCSYMELLEKRRSSRNHTDVPMTGAQLAFLLWTMNSVQDFRGETKAHTLRLVPSGGARHTFEVYVAALNVAGLEPGLYHYLPLENVGEKRVTVEKVGELPDEETLMQMVVGQKWATGAGALFFVATVPYRGEWRYGDLAHRMIMTDLGYVGQNFSLSSTAMNLGSCQMAGYDQELCDRLFGLDGENQFMLICMSAGSI